MPSNLSRQKTDLGSAPRSKHAFRPSKKAKLEKPNSKVPRDATPPPNAKPITKQSNTKGKVLETTPLSSVKGKEKAVDASQKELDTTLPTSFKVIVGSYEKLLYGLEGTASFEDADVKFNLKPVFIFPAHISCIKAVAASPNGGKWLATGSTDEIVKVWDLRRRKEIGGLMHHEGSITHLQFPSRSHLLSASDDGTLCLFRARDWAVLRSLKGHKGRVNCVAVHPSGKLALSVGKDRTLRMWDLMRGKGSASTKLGKEGELVRWSVDGSLFCVQSLSTIDIYFTDMRHLHTIAHPARLHDVKFCKRVDGEGEVLFAAAEDKKLSIYGVPTDSNIPPTIIGEMVGHSNRVKAVDTIKIALPQTSNTSSSRASTTLVSTISSDGKIHIYDLASLPFTSTTSPNANGEKEKLLITPVAVYDTKGSRLTCLALADGDSPEAIAKANGKRKREDEGVDESESAEDGDEGDWGPQQESSDDKEEDEEDEEDEDENEEEYESA